MDKHSDAKYVHKIEEYYDFVDTELIEMNSDPRFYTCGWSSSNNGLFVFNYNANGDIDPTEVAAYLESMIDKQLKHVDEGPITVKANVLHWAPYYAYPGSEKTFWDFVDTQTLKKYIKDPY